MQSTVKNYVKFTFAVSPDDTQFSRVFNTMQTAVDDMTPVFFDIANSFYVHMKEVFALEGAVGNRTHWEPLSSFYAAWKKVNYPSRKILHLTGALEESLTQKGDSNGVLEVRKMEMSIGTSLNYAKKHQTGGKFGNSVLPQRKIIELTDDVKLKWTHLLHEYVYKVQIENWRKLKAQ